MQKNKKKEKTSLKDWLKDNVKALFWALLIAMTVRSCALEPFNIPSGSMIPSLLVGDYLFVDKNSYGYSRYSFPFGFFPIQDRLFYTEPKRGDIVVFRLPFTPSVDYIKRVIGLPGDTVQVKNGLLYINGNPVKRTFIKTVLEERNKQVYPHNLYEEELPNGVKHQILEFSDTEIQDNTIEFKVPPDHFFMMGDNRDNSQDSRFLDKVGYIHKKYLIGNAFFIFYSNNGYSPLLFFWNWTKSIRWNRFFKGIRS